ncbi:hypothetical protein GCM10020331_087930 [Ectobacillus funiculus]
MVLNSRYGIRIIQKSDQSIHIVYNGPELASGTRYYYRVKVWDNFGRESEWSDVSWWETALFEESEWKAEWITPNPAELDPLTKPIFFCCGSSLD